MTQSDEGIIKTLRHSHVLALGHVDGLAFGPIAPHIGQRLIGFWRVQGAGAKCACYRIALAGMDIKHANQILWFSWSLDGEVIVPDLVQGIVRSLGTG